MKKYTLLWSILFIGIAAQAQYQPDSARSGKEILKLLVGNNMKIQDIDYWGALDAVGTFKNSNTILSMSEGVYLGTGSWQGPAVPNKYGNLTSRQKGPGLMIANDRNLSSISTGKLFDIAVLKFSFIPECDTIAFNYIFGSEEYPEYVNKKFNDVFGFFITGPGIEGTRNMAVLPDDSTPITINSVNMLYNKEYYISNPILQPGEQKSTIQFDGITTKLIAKSAVIPGKLYTIKIAIADVNDGMYDSGVFLEANSFNCYGNTMKDSVVAKITINIEFAFNSAVIPEKYYTELNKIVQQLKLNPSYKTDINGHTDNVGSADFNLQLSENRAKSVADYLISKGVAPAQVKYNGYGSTQPLNNNTTEAEKARNRRVEFIIRKPLH